jgi:diguanylate cyclase (GGDEF)-like protein/PAS domain S-box-containing protein
MNFRNLDDGQLRRILDEFPQEADVESEDVRHLLQELQIYQIELELQNRELRESQQALEASRDRYADLYDWAPVGYLTLTPEGLITDINLTGASLLGVERGRVLGFRSPSFLHIDDRRKWLDHLAHAVQTGGAAKCEVRSRLPAGKELHLRVQTQCQQSHGGKPVCRTAFLDASDEKRAEQALDASHRELRLAHRAISHEREFLQQVIDGLADPVLVINPDYEVLLMNAQARHSRNVPSECRANPRCHQIAYGNATPCHDPHEPCPLKEILANGMPAKVIHRHADPSGQMRTYELSSTPLRKQDGTLMGIIEVSRDITEHLALLDQLRDREVQLKRTAQHDMLTRLPNRQLFAERLHQAIKLARRNREHVGVIFLDIDYFKRINDSMGHAAGDAVLKEVARRLRHCVREADTVARLGGDEFTLILERLTRPEDAGLVVNKLVGRLEQPFEVNGEPVRVTASLGISLFPKDADSAEGLIKKADIAMYKVKREGRQGFRFFTEHLTALAFERTLMDADLRTALEQNQLVLFYQPQLHLRSGQIKGIEALIRWQHPVKGLLLPDRFIAVAEETGIITLIGEWVLREACSQLRAWQDAGLLPDISISVNLSGRQLEQPTFLDTVRSILEKTGLDPGALCLELTESVVMANPQRAERSLCDLRGLGIALSLDDFGTGYSSLSHLKRLPLTELKIDRSFVTHLPEDATSVAIVEAVIALGKGLSLTVTAEGIETGQQESFLREADCDVGQGYLYCQPTNADRLEQYVYAQVAAQ